MWPVDVTESWKDVFVDDAMIVVEMAVDDMRKEFFENPVVPGNGKSEEGPLLVGTVFLFTLLGRDVGMA